MASAFSSQLVAWLIWNKFISQCSHVWSCVLLRVKLIHRGKMLKSFLIAFNGTGKAIRHFWIKVNGSPGEDKVPPPQRGWSQWNIKIAAQLKWTASDQPIQNPSGLEFLHIGSCNGKGDLPADQGFWLSGGPRPWDRKSEPALPTMSSFLFVLLRSYCCTLRVFPQSATATEKSQWTGILHICRNSLHGIELRTLCCISVSSFAIANHVMQCRNGMEVIAIGKHQNLSEESPELKKLFPHQINLLQIKYVTNDGCPFCTYIFTPNNTIWPITVLRYVS